MNEEIFKRLQDQCWIYNTHPDMVDDKGRPCGFDTKKFALLLVRECLNIVENNNPCPPGTTIMYSLLQDEYFDKGWQVAVETKSNQIKQHFGVDNNSV